MTARIYRVDEKRCRGCGRRMLLWRWYWAHRLCAATMTRWSISGWDATDAQVLRELAQTEENAE